MVKMQFPELTKLIKELNAAKRVLLYSLPYPPTSPPCHPHFVPTLAHAAAPNVIDVAKMIRFNGIELV